MRAHPNDDRDRPPPHSNPRDAWRDAERLRSPEVGDPREGQPFEGNLDTPEGPIRTLPLRAVGFAIICKYISFPIDIGSTLFY